MKHVESGAARGRAAGIAAAAGAVIALAPIAPAVIAPAAAPAAAVTTGRAMAPTGAAAVRFVSAGSASARSASARFTPAPRTLRYGMRGGDVRRLQERLAALAYYPGRRDGYGYFGTGTLEAVWAFQEAQRIPVTGQTGPRTRWRLAHPSAIRPLIRNGPALRVEVDLGHRVLYVYHRHHVVLISHISSGGGYYYCSAGSCADAITPTGNFRTLWRVHGWHVSPLGLLYNPVFFHGGFAIHGDTEVPLQPVSHGCVRIPMDVADIFPGLVPREGIPVYVRR